MYMGRCQRSFSALASSVSESIGASERLYFPLSVTARQRQRRSILQIAAAQQSLGELPFPIMYWNNTSASSENG
jgi:hypothetical protein